MLYLRCIFLWWSFSLGVFIDSALFFKGAKQRPKLEIVYPENGAVLDSGNLNVRVLLKGYEFPSSFHDSSVCVGLSTEENEFLEECFSEAPDLKFQVSGLDVGSYYSVRVIFFERGEAIAVSVRNFRVGGIKGIVTGDLEKSVTIQTAVQVALSYQIEGKLQEARKIYDSILSVSPNHPYTLQLLGLNTFHSGDVESALPYLHQALLAITSSRDSHNLTSREVEGLEGFYNSLGECYRVLGRYQEAEDHYLSALQINPRNPFSLYNLGLTYQHRKDWHKAIFLFQQLVSGMNEDSSTVDDTGSWETSPDRVLPSAAHNVKFLHAKIRECDLLQTLYFGKQSKDFTQPNDLEFMNTYAKGRGIRDINSINWNQEVANCWLQGIKLFPKSHVMYNELGNLLLRVGQYPDALPMYRTAISLGNKVAQVNLAHVLESMGYADDSRKSYSSLVTDAVEAGLPSAHFLLREITVTYRVLPSADETVKLSRVTASKRLNEFLGLGEAQNFTVDNSAPLHFGFYTGFYWAYDVNPFSKPVNGNYDDQYSNVNLKMRLYSAYVKYCPALLQGVFIEDFSKFPRYKQKSSSRSVNENSMLQPGYSPENDSSESSISSSFNLQNPLYFRLLYTENDEMYLRMHGEGGVKIVELASMINQDGREEEIVLNANSASDGKVPLSSVQFTKRRYAKTFSEDTKDLSTISNLADHVRISSSVSRKETPRKIKIGFISRFFKVHSVGILSQGIIQKLSAKEKYEVSVFFVEGTTQELKYPGDFNSSVPISDMKGRQTKPSNKYHDPVQVNIVTHADYTYYLSSEISEISQFIRNMELDILIYPELGIDIICYFLAFTRLAPVQAVWIGHPDTSGIPTIDYVITGDMLPEFIARAGKDPVNKESRQLEIKGDGSMIFSMKRKEETGRYKNGYKSIAPFVTSSSMFSERNVFVMRNLGAVFLDSYAEYAALLQSAPRTSLLDRGKFIEYLRLPRAAHILLLSQPIYKLHEVFDETLSKILVQDKLAYVVIVDAVNVSTWQTIYVKRLTDKLPADAKDRIVFFVTTTMDDTLTAMAAAHVMLDPFPTSGYLSTLQALSIGLPVVTLPAPTSQKARGTKGEQVYDAPISGLTGLALYNMIQYYDLIVDTPAEYVALVHSITHNPKIRAKHVTELIARRSMLFERSDAVEDWEKFIDHAIAHR